MVKTECKVCGFVGHGYEVSAHSRKAHVGSIHVEIIEVDTNHKSALVRFPNGTKIYTPINMPEGKLAKLTVYGECNMEDFEFDIVDAVYKKLKSPGP